MTKKHDHPRVAVIGGGLAGLVAGESLSRVADTRLFESQKRLGGRIASIRSSVDGRILELGGADISRHHSAMHALSHRLGLKLTDLPHGKGPVDLLSKGESVSPRIRRGILRELETCIQYFTNHSGLTNHEAQGKNTSVESALAVVAGPDSIAYFSDLPRGAQSTGALQSLVTAAGGKHFFDPHDQRIKHGTTALIHALAGRLNGLIHCGTDCEIIEVRSDGVAVKICGPDGIHNDLYDAAVIATGPDISKGVLCDVVSKDNPIITCRCQRITLTLEATHTIETPKHAICNGPLRSVDLWPCPDGRLVHAELWATERDNPDWKCSNINQPVEQAGSFLTKALGPYRVIETVTSTDVIPGPAIHCRRNTIPVQGLNGSRIVIASDAEFPAYTGYMESAVRSGQRAARRVSRILNLYNSPSLHP